MFSALMLLRSLLLLALVLGLAADPALPAVVCAWNDGGMECGNCCGKSGTACCNNAPVPARDTPSNVAASSVDLKQSLAPVLIRLGAQPTQGIPPVSSQRRALARRPIQPRLDVTCIRLI